MLEIRAKVIQVLGEEASVQPIGTGGCGHCDSEGGCGSSMLNKVFCNNKPRIFKVRNEVHAKIGDEIQVSLPDGVLLRGTMKLYVLPLILLLVGGITGKSLSGEVALQDAYAVAGAIIGLFMGFMLARYSSSSGQAVASSIVTSRSSS